MLYPIKTLEGIIIAKQNYKEANQLITFYTREMGKIQVIAQGVRLHNSKLRPLLGLYDLGLFSFVVGRKGPRLIGICGIQSGRTLLKNPARVSLFANVAALLNRLVQGGGRNLQVWEKVRGLLLYLTGDDFEDKELSRIELKALYHILKELGYIGTNGGRKYSESSLRESLNRAIEASQL